MILLRYCVSVLCGGRGRSHKGLNNVRLKIIFAGGGALSEGLYLYIQFFCFCFLRTNIRGKMLYLFLGLVKRKRERPDKNRKQEDLSLIYENHQKMM